MMLKKDEKKRSVGRFEALRCKFEQLGQQCRLIGDISPGTGEGARCYCLFHYKVLTTSSDFNKYTQFVDWLEDYKNGFPVEVYGEDQFHKYNQNQLWELMGNRD